MLEKDRGVVLRSIKYGDNGLVVEVFSAHRGALSFMVKCGRRGRGSNRSVLFRQLSMIEFDYDYKERASLQRFSDVRLSSVYASIPYDMRKQSIALFLAEVLHGVLRHESQNEPLYAYVCNSLLWLDAAAKDFANFHLVFMTRLARFLGFYPNVEEWHSGDWFDLRNACFVRGAPGHADCLKEEEAALLPLMLRMNYYNMGHFVMNRAQRWRFLEVLAQYYRLHVPEFPELRSVAVLRDVFA